MPRLQLDVGIADIEHLVIALSRKLWHGYNGQSLAIVA